MANPEHLAKLKDGVEVWNTWRKEHPQTQVDLREADLTLTNLILANLRTADLRGANLRTAGLHDADLREANLTNAILTSADLGGADLANAYLIFADLSFANLGGANLTKADLGKADLRGANLWGANLTAADLGLAGFDNADLRQANLRGADLSGADLRNTKLNAADLSDARFGRTSFGATQLKGAVGLKSSSHFAPSFVDYFTLQQSWPLPIPFLRGCGLPDQYIDYLPSLLNQPIQFYSCFISYSTEDQEFADRLYADLQNKGVRCWFAPHDMQGGRKMHEQIEEAIRVYERLLLIISERSMGSRWVKTEIANARKKELQQMRQVLFPIRLVSFEAIRSWKLFDADAGDDSAREVRQYFIPDFTNWKDHDCYQRALDRLLRDLKAGSTDTSAVAAPL